MGQHDEARLAAREAASFFAEVGDQQKYLSARRTEGLALYRLRRFRDALQVFGDLTERTADPSLLQNIAACHRELNDFTSAIEFFLKAVDAYTRLNQFAGMAKARWHLGRVFLAQARYREALDTLRSVRDAFRELHMLQDVALVTIDIAQLLCVTGQDREVVGLCREAMEYFAAEGLTESEGSLIAIALIHEAAASARLTSDVLKHARRRVSGHTTPQYLFAE
jgi:tetratricopeptide (TPR) repeat protein